MSEHGTEYACQGYHPMDAWVRYGPIFTEKAGAEEERRHLLQQFPDTNFRVVSRPLPKWMPVEPAPCQQETYLEWGYPNADYEGDGGLGVFEVAFICDGLGPSDCDWRQVHETGDLTGGVTFTEFAAADADHHAQREGTA